MPYVIAFATTAGTKNVFPVVPASSPFFQTSGVHSAFPLSIPNNPFFQTSNIAYAFPGTASSNPFFQTSGVVSVFPFVIPDDTSKLLQLRFGSFNIASDYSLVTVSDDTGLYDPDTNPGGYNLPADPTDPNRARRDEVGLYLAYRVWTEESVPETIFPLTNDPNLDPWTYELATEELGVYQLFMIAAPAELTSADVYNRGNSIYDFASNAPLWYATQGAAIIDRDVINCLNRRRYQFLESVMCGDCDESYLELYAKYIGALNAFSIGTDESYLEGMKLWEEIREECNKLGCNCNC